MKLTEKRCVPCEGGTPPMQKDEIEKYVKQIPKGWKVLEGKRIRKEFKFKTYPEVMAFANKIALIAQDEGHHPDMEIHYGWIGVEFWTHAIGGLSENDFIMAAKIEA
jgi:4a-hydroxytetrahydrobiopterin dehydratase